MNNMYVKVTKIASINITNSNVVTELAYTGKLDYLKLGNNLHLVVEPSQLVTSPVLGFDNEFGLVYTNNSVYVVEQA